jgi:phytoene/squalene synthetase
MVLCALYSWFRPADDILDGEYSNSPPNLEEYILRKSSLLTQLMEAKSATVNVEGCDRLLVTMLVFAKKIGMIEEIKKYLPIIWKHMVDEYRWRTTKTIPTSKELRAFAQSQDEAIFRLMARIMGADREKFEAMSFDSLGAFTRTDWIQDLPEDLAVGLVHISNEECAESDLSYSALTVKDLKFPATLREIVRAEIIKLEPLWKLIRGEKTLIQNLFSNRLMGFIYQRLIFVGFEQSFNKARKQYL